MENHCVFPALLRMWRCKYIPSAKIVRVYWHAGVHILVHWSKTIFQMWGRRVAAPNRPSHSQIPSEPDSWLRRHYWLQKRLADEFGVWKQGAARLDRDRGPPGPRRGWSPNQHRHQPRMGGVSRVGTGEIKPNSPNPQGPPSISKSRKVSLFMMGSLNRNFWQGLVCYCVENFLLFRWISLN